MINALQIPATYMPQYDKFILPREKMGIFVHTNFASPSEFKCNSNALIYSLIGRELNELRELHRAFPIWTMDPSSPTPRMRLNILVINI